MPAAGASYGEQTWTRAASAAVARLIQERKLARPVLVGHFLNGTQVAARVALEHPELVRALVLLCGSPRYEPLESTPNWPRGLTLAQKVAAVDRGLAPRWFKTVTRTTRWRATSPPPITRPTTRAADASPSSPTSRRCRS
jgi:pimeloyl-ACP methyl ester carboxylesterase